MAVPAWGAVGWITIPVASLLLLVMMSAVR